MLKEKIFKSLIIVLFLFTFIDFVKAETNTLYLPENNEYYLRSQHTYSFDYIDEDGNPAKHTDYVPAIYTLIDDRGLAIPDENGKIKYSSKPLWSYKEYWGFNDDVVTTTKVETANFTLPYDPTSSDYSLVYCADLNVPIKHQSSYNKKLISESTYIPESAKKKLIAIIRNSYPYISSEEMIKNMAEANYLTQKTNDAGIKYYTSSNNDSADYNITEDEIVTAVSTAIFNFTNPDQVTEKYFRTARLSTWTITRSMDLWFNTYPSTNISYEQDGETYIEVGEKNEVVANNIESIYNYLMDLPEEQNEKSLEIKKIKYNSSDKNFTAYFNKEIKSTDNLKLEILEDNKLIKNIEIDQTDTDTYTFTIDDLFSLNNLKFKLTGTNYVEDDIYVFEPSEGKESSQTFIGLASTVRNIDYTYVYNVSVEAANANTGAFISFNALLFAIVIGAFLYYFPKGKYNSI